MERAYEKAEITGHLTNDINEIKEDPPMASVQDWIEDENLMHLDSDPLDPELEQDAKNCESFDDNKLKILDQELKLRGIPTGWPVEEW